MLPTVYCLCPTYRRPQHLVQTLIECWRRQTYPGPTHLILADDGGSLYRERLTPSGFHFGPSITRGTLPGRCMVFRQSSRFPSLPAKYNRLLAIVANLSADPVGLPKDCVVLIMEDDDVYLPWHVESYVEALQSHQWAHPECVYSTYGAEQRISSGRQSIIQEKATGRFHASLGFTLQTILAVGGWPETDRADFDQQLIAKLKTSCGSPGRPDRVQARGPSYVFRWSDTASPHGQSSMAGPDDTNWYQKAAERLSKVEPYDPVPQLDESALRIFRELGEL